jgi:hypothetical protein
LLGGFFLSLDSYKLPIKEPIPFFLLLIPHAIRDYIRLGIELDMMIAIDRKCNSSAILMSNSLRKSVIQNG